MVPEKDRTAKERKVFPTEARERLTSYRGRMTVKLCWTDISGQRHEMPKDCGLLPIMVRSVRCNLRSMSSAELVKHHEEPEEFGGYFVINGNERLIRYLILPRRNHVIPSASIVLKPRTFLYTIRCTNALRPSRPNKRYQHTTLSLERERHVAI